MKGPIFFPVTRNTIDSITNVLNLIKPSANALWYMRKQYKQYSSENSGASQKEVNQHFQEGCDIIGADVFSACTNIEWQSQKAIFSQLLLIELCAIYESWIDEILQVLSENDTDKRNSISDKFQFPEKYKDGLKSLLGTKSKILPEFLNGLRKHKKNNHAHIGELLVCYRYFKECRNAIVHLGSNINEKIVECEDAYARLSPSDLKLKALPNYFPISSGNKIRLNFRGIELFADIIIQLIVTLDSELSQSKNAEKVFLEMWGHTYNEKNLKENMLKREKQLNNCINNIGLPSPANVQKLVKYLKENNCISY